MLIFQPFADFDWMAYGGAERFADGRAPLISVGDIAIDDAPAEIVVDGVGVQLAWIVDDVPFIARAEGADGTRFLATLRPRMTFAQKRLSGSAAWKRGRPPRPEPTRAVHLVEFG